MHCAILVLYVVAVTVNVTVVLFCHCSNLNEFVNGGGGACAGATPILTVTLTPTSLPITTLTLTSIQRLRLIEWRLWLGLREEQVPEIANLNSDSINSCANHLSNFRTCFNSQSVILVSIPNCNSKNYSDTFRSLTSCLILLLLLTAETRKFLKIGPSVP